MDKIRILGRLEQDLAFFLISEACKQDPSKRGSSEMYRYKGLSISVNDETKSSEKVCAIRIGSLEAHFRIASGDKVLGGLMPEDEKNVQIWLNSSDSKQKFMAIFNSNGSDKKQMPIIPFDLEEFFEKG